MPSLARLGEQRAQVVVGTVARRDLVKIGDVVAGVAEGRLEARIQPDAGDAEVVQVRQFFHDAAQVADAVAIRVAERLRINFVEDRMFEPGGHVGGSFGALGQRGKRDQRGGEHRRRAKWDVVIHSRQSFDWRESWRTAAGEHKRQLVTASAAEGMVMVGRTCRSAGRAAARPCQTNSRPEAGLRLPVFELYWNTVMYQSRCSSGSRFSRGWFQQFGGNTLNNLSPGRFLAVGSLALLALTSPVLANDDQLIYSEMLNNGWANWGYGSTLNFNNFSPVHSGSNSLSATMPAWSRIWFVHDPIDTSLYTNFTFWANGGTSGGQRLQVAASTNGVDGTWVNIDPLQANTWQQITVSLAALGVANKTNLNYLWINNWSGTAQPIFYLDDVSLTAKPPPATVHVSVNATQTVRTVDARLFGVNTAAWDGHLDTPDHHFHFDEHGQSGVALAGRQLGGHLSLDQRSLDGWRHQRSKLGFLYHQFHSRGHQHPCAGVIYRQLRQQHAGGSRLWVRMLQCDQSLPASNIGKSAMKSAAVGRTDNNTNAPWQPHDPWTYAMRFKDYYNQMKAVDPTIKIGAVADITEDGTANYTNHPVVNPRHRRDPQRLDAGDAAHDADQWRDPRFSDRTQIRAQ